MECRDVRQLAEAYVTEQLLVETTRAVVAHLDRCPACRAETEGLRRLRAATKSAFAAAPGLAPDPAFAAALASRLRAQAVPVRAGQAWWQHRWLALAASVLLIIGAGWGWREWSASGLSALLRAAVGDHRFCALTFKLAEPPIPLDEAAHRYGGVYGLLVDVEPSTTALSGGELRIVERHSCVFEGRRFAHIVLRYRDETVSLLVADDARAAVLPGGDAVVDTTLSDMPVTDGFHVATFRGARHVVFVVSSLARDDVREVAQAMIEPVSRALAGT